MIDINTIKLQDMTEEEYNSLIIQNFARKVIENSKNIEPKYAKLIDKHFWDLI